MEQSLQDQYYPNGTCFGCGPCNDDGLQLKSYSTVTHTFKKVEETVEDELNVSAYPDTSGQETVLNK